MRELQRQGWTYGRVAKHFECSYWTARDICEYRTRLL